MERQLVERAQGGDKVAFSRLVRLHQDAVYRFAFYFTGATEVARDLAQEVMLRFYRTLDRFDPALPVRPWLLRIASNLCKDWYKHRHVEARHIHQGAPPADDEIVGCPTERPDATFDRTQELEQVREAVLALREDYRAPLLMKCVEGLSYEEISEATGLPVTTLKIRVVRAREQLRAAMESRPRPSPRGAGAVADIRVQANGGAAVGAATTARRRREVR